MDTKAEGQPRKSFVYAPVLRSRFLAFHLPPPTARTLVSLLHQIKQADNFLSKLYNNLMSLHNSGPALSTKSVSHSLGRLGALWGSGTEVW